MSAWQETRRRERSSRWSELSKDLGDALRHLARGGASTAILLLTLALGIGSMTAIFSVVESVVLRPFPFAHPRRLVFVRERVKGQDDHLSVGNYVDLKAASSSFSALAAFHLTSLNLTGGDRPERVLGARVTSDFFTVFGVRPELGRGFLPAEDSPGQDDVAIVGHGLWVHSFGADPGIVGRSIRLSDRPYRVVGVMREGFDPTLSGEELWLPIAFTPAQRAQHDEHYLEVVGRLRPGISPQRAGAELGAAMARLAARYPTDNEVRGVSVRALAEVLIGDYRTRLLLLLGAVTLVLLIACGNATNLLLAQGAVRAKEIAIRAAIGAGSRRIARQLLTESVLLALGSGMAGTVLAALGIRILLASAPPGIPRLAETRIDAGVLAFALGIALASSLIFGLAPALRAARRDPQEVLKVGERGMGMVRDRLRSGLVLAEVAFSLLLLIGAGLLIRSARHLETVAPGFDPAGVTVAQIALPDTRYREVDRVRATFERIRERLEHAPGVERAAVVSRAPLGPEGGANGLLPEGRPFRPENLIPSTLRIVTPDYFAALRIPLERGRLFDGGDLAGRQRVIVVSEELARRAWPREDPLGKRIACCEGSPEAPSWKTVVGVVGDVRSEGPTVDVVPEFYLPLEQMPPPAVDWLQRSMTLVARGPSPGLVTAALRRAVREVDPALPVYGVARLASSLRASTAAARFHTLLLTVLGAVGLLLAMVGIYSVIAYFIGLRSREIAIRMALGATSQDIARLLTWQGVRPILAGIALGGFAAGAATRWLASSLYGIQPTDSLTFVIVVLLLLAIGLTATLVPVRRATRIELVRALHS